MKPNEKYINHYNNDKHEKISLEQLIKDISSDISLEIKKDSKNDDIKLMYEYAKKYKIFIRETEYSIHLSKIPFVKSILVRKPSGEIYDILSK